MDVLADGGEVRLQRAQLSEKGVVHGMLPDARTGMAEPRLPGKALS
jgi:hypothetical protein